MSWFVYRSIHEAVKVCVRFFSALNFNHSNTFLLPCFTAEWLPIRCMDVNVDCGPVATSESTLLTSLISQSEISHCVILSKTQDAFLLAFFIFANISKDTSYFLNVYFCLYLKRKSLRISNYITLTDFSPSVLLGWFVFFLLQTVAGFDLTAFAFEIQIHSPFVFRDELSILI